jgi:HK97 family phage major capsid protein
VTETVTLQIEDVDDRIRARVDAMYGTGGGDRQRGAGLALYGSQGDPQPGGGDGPPRSVGEAFIRSRAFGLWMSRYPEGAPSDSHPPASSDPLTVRAPLSRIVPKFRTLITAADASAGTLIRPDYRGLLEPGLVRPLTVRDVVTVIPVTTDAIEYVKESSRVTAAAPVAEASALTGTTGTKPEGGLVFAIVSEPVRTLAEWVPATKRVVQDAPQLRAYIDGYLTEDLAIELEDQIVAGSGSGENFRGILNTVGIGTVGPPVAPASALDALRQAKRMVRVNGKTNATAVLLNPQDAEFIDLLKVNAEANNFASGVLTFGGGGPFGTALSTVWGLPIIESEAVPAGTGLVGDFRRAVLFDRESVTMSVGTVGDDFIRNLVRVLAELRAGFGVLRPAAFVAVDLA